MNKKLCMNVLDVIDGKAKPTRELVQAVVSIGAEAFHAQWVAAMTAAGWRPNGRETNHVTLHTPHIRRWSLLVDGQRGPLIEVSKAKVEATWEESDEAE